MRNGASKINGSIIYPGEEFSVHDAVVPFNAENGYELAGSYENGTTVVQNLRLPKDLRIP